MQLPEPIPPPTGALEWLKWAAVVGPLILTAYVLVRQNTSKLWKEERDAAVAKSERLAQENKELTAAKATVERELGECRARTDLGAMMEQHRAFHIEMLSSLTMVASASDGRTERMIAALDETRREMGALTAVLRGKADGVERP